MSKYTYHSRYTKADLKRAIDHLNKVAGQNPDVWTQHADGAHAANVGTYTLLYMDGGVRLTQIANADGCQRHVTRPGTKRETYGRVRAYALGFEAGAK